MTREQAEKELIAMLGEAKKGPCQDAKAAFSHLRESLGGNFPLTEEEQWSYEQKVFHEAEAIQALGLLEE